MTAVVRPVGIYHPDLGDGRISLFLLKVILAEGDIVDIHSKTELAYQICQSVFIKVYKAFHGLNSGRTLIYNLQGLKCIKLCFSCFYRVDHMMLDSCEFVIRNAAFDNVYSCRMYSGTFSLRNDLDTLCSRIGTLVKLSGQVFYCENPVCTFLDTGKFFFCEDVIKLGLCKYCP